MRRVPLIAGNWKMNMNHLEAIQLVEEIGYGIKDLDTINSQLLIIPPFTDIRSVRTVIDNGKFSIDYGAQDVSIHAENGAYTGEISANMLKTLGCKYVIVGHSERRKYHGETDQQVGEKAQIVLDNSMLPIICCGECLEIRRDGKHIDYVLKQLELSFNEINADEYKMKNIVIAYEPIWAIGTGEVATGDTAQEVCFEIRDYLKSRFNSKIAESVRVLYGGSVKSSTIKNLMAQPDIDGVLVGGGSLKAEEFLKIASYDLW